MNALNKLFKNNIIKIIVLFKNSHYNIYINNSNNLFIQTLKKIIKLNEY